MRTFMTYKPLQFFMWLGVVPFALGVALCMRWLVLFFGGTPRTHLPSLIAAAIFILIGFLLWMLGLVADLLAVNRKLLEEIQVRIRRTEFDGPDA